MNTDPRARQQSLQNRLTAVAYSLLAKLRVAAALAGPVVAKASDDLHTVVIRVKRVTDTTPAAEKVPGRFLSPTEAAIWLALEKGSLAGKAISRAISQRYSPHLRTILSNLVAREVLVRVPAGYRRASRSK